MFLHKKQFGQHFLKYFPEEFIPVPSDLADIKTLCVVEIGPGTGAVTKPLLEFFATLKLHVDYHYVDIDADALEVLSENIAAYSYLKNIKVIAHNQDILTVKLNEIYAGQDAVYVLGALPYNISKMIINWTFEQLSTIEAKLFPVNFIIQKEVADDYLAKPPQADFLSHVMNLFAEKCEAVRVLPPGSFSPPPKVTSTMLRITPSKLTNEHYLLLDDIAGFIKTCYSFRRKKIKQVLKGSNVESPLLELRAEQISTAQFVELYSSLQKSSVTF